MSAVTPIRRMWCTSVSISRFSNSLISHETSNRYRNRHAFLSARISEIYLLGGICKNTQLGAFTQIGAFWVKFFSLESISTKRSLETTAHESNTGDLEPCASEPHDVQQGPVSCPWSLCGSHLATLHDTEPRLWPVFSKPGTRAHGTQMRALLQGHRTRRKFVLIRPIRRLITVQRQPPFPDLYGLHSHIAQVKAPSWSSLLV